eukprot:COSAG01_NODE_9970_length_2288_cov_11.761207_2_plen_56_part_00
MSADAATATPLIAAAELRRGLSQRCARTPLFGTPTKWPKQGFDGGSIFFMITEGF